MTWSALTQHVQIRAYTSQDKFSETSWSQAISTEPDNTAILVGITVPIILLVIILLAFVLVRKLQCGPCHKSAGHHITRGGPPVDSVGGGRGRLLTYLTTLIFITDQSAGLRH